TADMTLDATLAPVGFTYNDQAQSSFPCPGGAPPVTNSLTIHNLDFEIRDSIGVLDSSASAGAGGTESVSGVPLPLAGNPYFVRITNGATNDIQLYRLEMAFTPAGGFPEADLSVTKTDGLTMADPGDPITYTMTVINSGPNA